MSSIQSILKIIQDAAKTEIIKRSKSIAPTSQQSVLTKHKSPHLEDDSPCSNTHRRSQSLSAPTLHNHTLSKQDAYKEPLLEFQQSDELDYRSQMGNSRVPALSTSSWISFFRPSDSRTGNSARVADTTGTRRRVEERKDNTLQKDLYWGNVVPSKAQDARFKLFQPSTWFSMVARETVKQTPPRQVTLEEHETKAHKYVRDSKQRHDNDRPKPYDPFELIRQYRRQVPNELSKPVADSKTEKQPFTTSLLHKKLLACVENWSRHSKDTKSKSTAEVKMTQEAPVHISKLSAGHESYLPRPRLQPNASKFVEGLFHETRHFSMQSRQYGSSSNNSKQASNVDNVKHRVDKSKKKTCVIPVTGACGCGPRQDYKPPVSTPRKPCKKKKKESTGTSLQLLPGCSPRARPNCEPITKERLPCSKVNTPLPSFSDMMKQTKFSRPIDSRLFDDLRLLQPSLSLAKTIELQALKTRKNHKAALMKYKANTANTANTANKANENAELECNWDRSVCSPQTDFGVGYTREAAFPSGLLIVQPPPPKSSDGLSRSSYLSPTLGGQSKFVSATLNTKSFLNTRSFSSYARPHVKDPHAKIGKAEQMEAEGKTLLQRITAVRNVLQRRASISKQMTQQLEKQNLTGYFPSRRATVNRGGNEFDAPEGINGLHPTMLNENDVYLITRDTLQKAPCFADESLRYSINTIKAIRNVDESDDQSVAKVESLDPTEVSPQSKISGARYTREAAIPSGGVMVQPPPPKTSDGHSRSPYLRPALGGQNKLLSAKIHTNSFLNERYFSSYARPDVKDLHKKIGEAKLLEVERKTLHQRIIDVRNVLKRFAYSKQIGIPKLHEKDSNSTGYFPSKRTYYTTLNHGGNEFDVPESIRGLHSTMLNENDVYSITRDTSQKVAPCFADGYLLYTTNTIQSIRNLNETDDNKSVATVKSLDLTEVSPQSKIYENITNEINSHTGPNSDTNKINFYEPNNPFRFSKDKTLLNMHKTDKIRQYSPTLTTETNKKFNDDPKPKFQVIERFYPKLKFVSNSETSGYSKESLRKIQPIKPFSASLDPSSRKASANLHKTVKLANYQSDLINEKDKRNYFVPNPISYKMDSPNIALKSTNIPADSIRGNSGKIARPLTSYVGNTRSRLIDAFFLNLIDKQPDKEQSQAINNKDSYKIIYELRTASKHNDQTKHRRTANEFTHSLLRKKLSNTHKTTKLKQPSAKEDIGIRKYTSRTYIKPQVQSMYSQGYSDLQTYPSAMAEKAKMHSSEPKDGLINAVKAQLHFAPEHKFHATNAPSIHSMRKTVSNMHKTTPIKRCTSLFDNINITRKYHTDSVHATYDMKHLVNGDSYHLCIEKVTNLVKTIEELKCPQSLKENAYNEIAVMMKHDLLQNYKDINGETKAIKSAKHIAQNKHDLQQLLTILNNSNNSSHVVQTNMHKRFFANQVSYKLEHKDCDSEVPSNNSAEKKKPAVNDCCAKRSARKPFKECRRPPQMDRNPSRTCVDYRKPTMIKCDYKSQQTINGDVRGVTDRVAKVCESHSNSKSPNKYGAAFDAVEADLKNKKQISQTEYCRGLVDAVCEGSEKIVSKLKNSCFSNAAPSKETTGECNKAQLKEEKPKQQGLNREFERNKEGKMIVGSACERNEMFVSTLKHRMTKSQFSEIALGESSDKNFKIEKTKPSQSLEVSVNSASLRKEAIVNSLEQRMVPSSCASSLKPVSKSSKSNKEEKSNLTLQCAHAESRRIEEGSLSSKQDCIQDCIKNNAEMHGKDRIMAANSHRFERCNTKEETIDNCQETKDCSSKFELQGNGEKGRECNLHETYESESKSDSDSIKEMIMEANRHRLTTCTKSVPHDKTNTVATDAYEGVETAFKSPCEREEVHARDKWTPCTKIQFSCPSNQKAMTPQTSQYEAQSPAVRDGEMENLNRVESQTSDCAKGIQLKPGSSTEDVFTFPAKTDKGQVKESR